jgi:hypothetical protein
MENVVSTILSIFLSTTMIFIGFSFVSHSQIKP